MRALVQLAAPAILAVVAGISFVVQAGVNTRLRDVLGSPNWAALASYAGGTVAMVLVVIHTIWSAWLGIILYRMPADAP